MNDFKAITSHRMTMSGSYKEVGPGEEFPTAKFGEESWTLAVKKSGMLIELTYEDQVNDDLDAFLQIPTILGQEYAEYFEYCGWKKLYSGLAIHFTAKNGNRLTTDSQLSISGLNRASQLFMSMMSGKEGENRRFMNVMGKHVIVPPSLSATANALHTATMVNESTRTGNPQPNINPHTGKYAPIVTPYLGSSFKTTVKADSGKTTYSGNDRHWFMAAATDSVPCFQAGFLDGKHVPAISNGDVDYKTLGMYWRAWGAFGIEFFDPEHAWVYCEGNPPSA